MKTNSGTPLNYIASYIAIYIANNYMLLVQLATGLKVGHAC